VASESPEMRLWSVLVWLVTVLLLLKGTTLPLAIAVVAGDIEGGLLADLHGGDALIPA